MGLPGKRWCYIQPCRALLSGTVNGLAAPLLSGWGGVRVSCLPLLCHEYLFQASAQTWMEQVTFISYIIKYRFSSIRSAMAKIVEHLETSYSFSWFRK